MVNATANLVLNLSGTELQGTQFANLVKYSDYIMLGIGVKDLTKIAGKSVFPDLYKKAKDNVSQLNRQSIKYFLASYMRLGTQIPNLAQIPNNTSAKTVEEVYNAIFKNLDATADGKAIIKEADDLAKDLGNDLGKETYIDDLFASIKNQNDFRGFRTLCVTNNKVTVELVDAGWSDVVKGIRKDYMIGKSRNIAKIEFDGQEFLIASGTGYSGQMVGKFVPKQIIDDLQNGQRLFTYSLGRTLDTELIGMEYFAKQKRAVKGQKYPNVTGEIKITSDLCPCPSCSDVFQQFSDMFPSLRIKIVTTTTLKYTK